MQKRDRGGWRVLLLMPTTTYRADAFFEAARKMGVATVAGSDRCHVLAGEWGIPLALDFREPEAAARRIVEFARDHPLDAVLPLDDKTTGIAALACETLQLPHNPPEAARAARNKRRMREALAGAGVPVPRFAAFPLDAPTRNLIARVEAGVGFPCVLKPLILSASRGVMRANDARELTASRERLEAILRLPEIAAIHGAEAREFLVEEFIPGQEVALEGIVSKGRLRALALFEKPDPLDGPFFEETIYLTPPRLDRPLQDRIVERAAQAVAALGLREGAVHAELRLNESWRTGEPGPWVIEVAARSIGGLCSRTLRFGVGVSLEELILRHALGMDLDRLGREEKAAGVMMIPIPRGGVLRSVAGLEEARAVTGVESIEITAALQHLLVPLPEGSAYLGFIVARGESADPVEQALRRSHACLSFEIAPAIELQKTRD